MELIRAVDTHLTGLSVKILAVHDEEAFLDLVVVLEQRGRLERGERLAAAGGVPDVAVAAVVADALDDGLDRVNLIRAHDHELLLAGDEDHVAADHLAEGAFDEERLRKAVEVGNLRIVFAGELVNGQETVILRSAQAPQ